MFKYLRSLIRRNPKTQPAHQLIITKVTEFPLYDGDCTCGRWGMTGRTRDGIVYDHMLHAAGDKVIER